MQPATEDIRRIIEGYLAEHLEDDSVDHVMAAVVRGEVIHRNLEGRPSIVAFRNGILFIAGKEYVVDGA
jgi:hypothetical protein